MPSEPPRSIYCTVLYFTMPSVAVMSQLRPACTGRLAASAIPPTSCRHILVLCIFGNALVASCYASPVASTAGTQYIPLFREPRTENLLTIVILNRPLAAPLVLLQARLFSSLLQLDGLSPLPRLVLGRVGRNSDTRSSYLDQDPDLPCSINTHCLSVQYINTVDLQLHHCRQILLHKSFFPVL